VWWDRALVRRMMRRRLRLRGMRWGGRGECEGVREGCLGGWYGCLISMKKGSINGICLIHGGVSYATWRLWYGCS